MEPAWACGQSAQSGGALKGAAFWEWFAEGQLAPAAEGGGSGLYGVTVADSTFPIIQQNAQAMKACAVHYLNLFLTPPYCGMTLATAFS